MDKLQELKDLIEKNCPLACGGSGNNNTLDNKLNEQAQDRQNQDACYNFYKD